ncbi:hypothetical protein BJP36_35720 [Moorena producens JHB]|uniref:Uncharacterized protein n=1 Tax=Moorena producens (strain JHB) TaxID=1454205 RepID=A0A9Q9UW25_MOOP1|nr:hypothetical protein [Moorena producens]WAN69441.1 hypothetical protein BJP36_35720 [Moorena producens JHB]
MSLHPRFKNTGFSACGEFYKADAIGRRPRYANASVVSAQP